MGQAFMGIFLGAFQFDCSFASPFAAINIIWDWFFFGNLNISCQVKWIEIKEGASCWGSRASQECSAISNSCTAASRSSRCIGEIFTVCFWQHPVREPGWFDTCCFFWTSVTCGALQAPSCHFGREAQMEQVDWMLYTWWWGRNVSRWWIFCLELEQRIWIIWLHQRCLVEQVAHCSCTRALHASSICFSTWNCHCSSKTESRLGKRGILPQNNSISNPQSFLTHKPFHFKSTILPNLQIIPLQIHNPT